MNKENMKVLTNVIGAVESGGQEYGKRNYRAYAAPYTNSMEEHTVTLGWAQNYGARAEKLVREILVKDPATFRKLDSAGIERTLVNSWEDWKWSPTMAQREVLIAIIDSNAGHICQDELFMQQTEEYVNECERSYTDDARAVMMYCEIRHLGGKNPVMRIFDRCKGDYSLEAIMKALKKDQDDKTSSNQVGDKKYWSRHEKCREFIEKYAICDQKEVEEMTGAQEIDAVIIVAKGEIGYLEKRTNAQLDYKTANAGYNNFTKYWRDVCKNGRMQHFGYAKTSGFAGGSNWPYCACGLEWTFTEALGLSRAKALLMHPDYAFINCEDMFAKAKNAKRLIAKPKRGAIVLFRRGKEGTEHYHTELCTGVSGNIMSTIGFNTSGASSVIANGGGVCAKRYDITTLNADYVWPKYADGTENSGNEELYTGTSVTYLKLGSSGTAVADMQKKLIACGYCCGSAGADGDFGEATLKAVKDFQKYNGLKVDGVVGDRTTKMLNTAYTALTKKEPLDPTQAKRLYVGKIKNDGVDVRTWAGREYGNIKNWPKLSKNNLVDVLDYTQKDTEGKKWLFVRIAGKHYGFVQKKNVAKA